MDQPRHHHYVLAHIALRQVALANPVQYLAALASPDAEAFLQTMYDAVCQHGADDAPPPDFTAADLNVHLVRIERFPCAIVEMPPPRAVAEAFYTALILLVDPEAEPKPEPEDVRARYFTLEMGLSLDGEPRTVLAEWTDDAHANFGDGPPADMAAFARRLAVMIDE